MPAQVPVVVLTHRTEQPYSTLLNGPQFVSQGDGISSFQVTRILAIWIIILAVCKLIGAGILIFTILSAPRQLSCNAKVSSVRHHNLLCDARTDPIEHTPLHFGPRIGVVYVGLNGLLVRDQPLNNSHCQHLGSQLVLQGVFYLRLFVW